MAALKNRPPLVAYTGMAAITLQWLTILSFYILDFNFAADLRPISYFATQPATQKVFTLGFALSGLLVWAFVALWARNFVRISLTIFSISMGAFIAMATIPFKPEHIQNLIQHENITALFSFSFILGMLLVGLRNLEPRLRRVSLICSAIGLIFGFAVWTTPGSNKSVVFMEIICAVTAQYWIMWLSRYLMEQKRAQLGSLADQDI